MRQLKQERLLYLGGSRSCFKIMPILGVIQKYIVRA